VDFKFRISYPGESYGAQSCTHELPNNSGVAVCCWVKCVEMRRVPVGQLYQHIEQVRFARYLKV